MRVAALCLLACALVNRFAAAEPAGEERHTDIGRVLISEYPFVAKPRPTAAPAPFLADPAFEPPASPPDTGVVTMAPVTVRETSSMNELHADLALQKAGAGKDAMIRKLGIGVHVAPAGPVGFYAVTVFYVPVFVGFGFSW